MFWQPDLVPESAELATRHTPFANFLSRVFLTMAGGGMITAAGAEAVVHDSGLRAILTAGDRLTLFGWITVIAPLGLVLLISGGIKRLSARAARTLFLIYAVLVGLSLGTVFQLYAGANIAAAFVGAGAGFTLLAIYGLTTRRELGRMGSFLMIALFGLIVALLVNFFTASAAFDVVLAILGVLVFAGLTVYGAQKLEHFYGEGRSDRMAVIAALTLYLDLLNLFLSLLRLTGRRR